MSFETAAEIVRRQERHYALPRIHHRGDIALGQPAGHLQYQKRI